MSENGIMKSFEKSFQSLNVQITHKLGFPSTGRRALDYIAKKDNEVVFMKIARRIYTKNTVFKELKKLTEFLNINAVLIADRINSDEIEEGVLHMRDRIGIVQFRTISNFVRGDKVYIYEFKGMYYVKINGEKLKELRMKKGYGLRELAKAVGVSVKALQKYEDGLINMSAEKAYRFMEIFNEEFEQVLKEVDIFRDRIIESVDKRRETVHGSPVYDREKVVLVQRLIRYGINAEHFDHIPSDIILSTGMKNVFISIIDSSMDSTTAVSKSYDNKHISQVLNGIAINIVKDDVPRDVVRDVECCGTVYKYSDVVGNIRVFSKEIEGEKAL